MSDAELLLLVESRKKSGFIAALLNLFIPGAGYIYCGRWLLGIFAFFFVVGVFFLSLGLAVIGLVLMLVIDGYLCAGRYNRKLIERVLKERAEIEGQSATKEPNPIVVSATAATSPLSISPAVETGETPETQAMQQASGSTPVTAHLPPTKSGSGAKTIGIAVLIAVMVAVGVSWAILTFVDRPRPATVTPTVTIATPPPPTVETPRPQSSTDQASDVTQATDADSLFLADCRDFRQRVATELGGMEKAEAYKDADKICQDEIKEFKTCIQRNLPVLDCAEQASPTGEADFPRWSRLRQSVAPKDSGVATELSISGVPTNLKPQ